MNKLRLGRQTRRRVPLKEKRASAYHEAGHAAILWMLGLARDIEYISMHIGRGRVPYLALKTCSFETSRQGAGQVPARLQERVKKAIMFYVAGLAAESRLVSP